MKTFIFWVAFIFLVVIGFATVIGLFNSKVRNIGHKTLTIPEMIKNSLILGLMMIVIMMFTVPSVSVEQSAAVKKQETASPVVNTKIETQDLQLNSSSVETPEYSPSPSPSPSHIATPKPSIKPSATPEPTPTPTPKPVYIATPTPTPAPVVSGWSCNCEKSCDSMSSCQEAYFQLNSCGCQKRDGDNDGIPCEAICN